MTDFRLGADIPLGFGIALTKNIKAMEKFSQLTDKQKREIIEGSRGVTSKSEMQQYVNGLIPSNELT